MLVWYLNCQVGIGGFGFGYLKPTWTLIHFRNRVKPKLIGFIEILKIGEN
jgi:hypothetical protein